MLQQPWTRYHQRIVRLDALPDVFHDAKQHASKQCVTRHTGNDFHLLGLSISSLWKVVPQ